MKTDTLDSTTVDLLEDLQARLVHLDAFAHAADVALDDAQGGVGDIANAQQDASGRVRVRAVARVGELLDRVSGAIQERLGARSKGRRIRRSGGRKGAR